MSAKLTNYIAQTTQLKAFITIYKCISSKHMAIFVSVAKNNALQKYEESFGRTYPLYTRVGRL